MFGDFMAEMHLILHWKPVGESKPALLANAYLLIEVEPGLMSTMREKLSEHAFTSVDGGSRSLIMARTDERGFVRIVPSSCKGPADALCLSNLSPTLFPLGASMKAWWTHERKVFDDVLAIEESTKSSSHPLHWMNTIKLVFDDRHELPGVLEHGLAYADNGPELREQLLARREDVFPAAILEPAEDGALNLVLHDPYLELAIDCALRVLRLSELGTEQNMPVHQLLIEQVTEVVRKKGQAKSALHDLASRHERLCGGEYQALRDDIGTQLTRCTRYIDEPAKTLAALCEPAFLELSAHPYPHGRFEHRESGRVSQQWAAKLILDSTALTLRHEIANKLYDRSDEDLDDRLLSIAAGTGDPHDASGAEKFLAQATTVVTWLNKKGAGIARKGASSLAGMADPKAVDQLTQWLEKAVVGAARMKQVSSAALVGAVTRAMRMAQVWTRAEANFEYSLTSEDVPLQGAPQKTLLSVSLANAERWNKRFDRAAKLLKLLNIFALVDGMLKPVGQRDSVAKQLSTMYGFVEGTDTLLKIVANTTETELGVALKSMSKMMSGLNVYVQSEALVWSVDHSNTLGEVVGAGNVAVSILTLALELTADTPLPALKAVLLVVGVALAIAAEFTLDSDEKFLEQYRPGCQREGGYLNALDACRFMNRALDDAEWENHKTAERAAKLGC
ncbi:MAG: hypothetical protein JWN04_4044 [Myxococcaceae bacterium]|nr:hypothetical protein [Myxococcaceae bacterium]